MPILELIFGFAMLLALGLAGTFVIQSHNHRLNGLVELRWAITAGLAGLAFMSLRGAVPLLIVAVCGQTLFLTGFAFLYLALARSIGRTAGAFPFPATLFPVFIGGLCYFSVVQKSLDGRIAVASLGIAAMLGWTARLAAQPAHPGYAGLRVQLRWMFSLLVLLSAIRVLRVGITLAFDPNPNLHLLDPGQGLLIYVEVLGSLAQAAGTLWIALCAQREEDRVRADTDGLTGLLNRRAFEELLDAELKQGGDKAAEISLLLIDLDSFKSMNDDFGHLAGDMALRRVSDVLLRSVRSLDALARFGGDEFAVLLRSAESGQGLLVAERVRQNLVDMRKLSGGRKITASLGVATALPGDTPVSLIERADKALYQSKQRGRNRLTHFDDEDSDGEGDFPAPALIH